MAEFELVQERNISGKGILRVPSEADKTRLFVLYASVIRRPRSEYLNFNYLPPRSRYGFLTFLRNGYVIATGEIEYPRQSYDGVTDITGQNLIAIKCAYEGILQTFTNFAVALQLIPISVTDLIAEYEYLNLSWDEVRVVCYADTAVNLRLYSLKFDTCDEEKDRPRKPPPPPPPPEESPPGTPLENLDPPYEDEDNPDNITEPFPGDDNSPFPVGEQCVSYLVIVDALQFDGNIFRIEAILFGEIEDVGVANNGASIYVDCRGGQGSIDPPAPECLPEVTRCLVGGSSEPFYSSATFISATPI
jgi:hypothetical protein